MVAVFKFYSEIRLTANNVLPVGSPSVQSHFSNTPLRDPLLGTRKGDIGITNSATPGASKNHTKFRLIPGGSLWGDKVGYLMWLFLELPYDVTVGARCREILANGGI